MKKLTIVLAVAAMLGSNAAFAQTTGRGASQATTNAGGNNGMAWAIGLGCLGVVATVVGITAASAASSPSTFGH